MMLVARIDYALTRGINWLTMCLIERARGFNSSEAGDFLDALKPDAVKCSYCPTFGGIGCALNCDCERRAYFRQKAEQELWAPPGGNAQTLIIGTPEFNERFIAGVADTVRTLTQTPEAAQPGENPAGVTPPTPAGSPDPSRVTVGAVRGEGSPADSDIPSSPAGERPTWVDWAVPAICDVLAEHVPAEGMLGNIHCGHYVWDESADDTTWASCGQFADETDWREHVAPLIAERLYLASKPPLLADWPETGLDMGARIDGASEIFPQHRTTQK